MTIYTKRKAFFPSEARDRGLFECNSLKSDGRLYFFARRVFFIFRRFRTPRHFYENVTEGYALKIVSKIFCHDFHIEIVIEGNITSIVPGKYFEVLYRT